MATIPGSHFTVKAGGVLNIVETATGKGLAPPVPGASNLEVYTGSSPVTPPLAPGYQGLAVLTAGGQQLDLHSGTYAVTDNGTGKDTLSAFGSHETIAGGSAVVTLNLDGNDELAIGGAGSDTISVQGNFDTVETGAGSDTVNIFGSFDTVEAGAFGPHSSAFVDLSGGQTTFADGPQSYSDTVVGFSSGEGDKIQLGNGDTASYAVAHASPTNGGADTLITLNDGSTILLKGIAHINSSFFS
jgi:hypothetical protein